VTYRGKHFDVESAKIWDLPDSPPPIGIAVSGPGSCRLAGRHADVMIAVEPRAELGEMFDAAGGAGKPRVGQIALSYDPDPQSAVKRAMDQFRWFTGNWRVNAELPIPASFDTSRWCKSAGIPKSNSSLGPRQSYCPHCEPHDLFDERDRTRYDVFSRRCSGRESAASSCR